MIILTTVATKSVRSFLESPNRLNVALSRARHHLFIVGHANCLAKSKVPVGVVCDCQRFECLSVLSVMPAMPVLSVMPVVSVLLLSSLSTFIPESIDPLSHPPNPAVGLEECGQRLRLVSVWTTKRQSHRMIFLNR